MCRKMVVATLLCLSFLFNLGACQNSTLVEEIGSEYWSEYPSFTPGKLEADVLGVTSWNSGRLEATSYETMAETPKGYYLVYMNYLYYADKENLDNWVLVCKNTNCSHTFGSGCSASVLSERIIVKDNRLFTLVESGTFPEIYSGKAGVAVMSVAPDGSDKKLEYVLKEGEFTTDAVIAALLYSDQLLYNAQALLPDGRQSGYLFRITDDGTKTVKTITDFNKVLITSTPTNIVYGIRLFSSTILDDSGELFYYYRGDALNALDVAALPGVGGYLCGDTLRYFSPEDGYYDYNIKTGETVFLEKAHLQNSRASVLLPNCILETTLFGSNNTTGNISVDSHRARLFNGSQWLTVTLPAELQKPNDNVYISIMGISSDSVLIACYNAATYTTTYHYPISIYRIPLDMQNPIMEYCGMITRP